MLPWHHVGFPIEFPKWWASGSNTIISSKFGFKMLSFLGSGAAWISGSQLSHATSAVESSMDGHSFFFGFPVNLGLKRWQMDGTKDVWITVWCFTKLYQPLPTLNCLLTSLGFWWKVSSWHPFVLLAWQRQKSTIVHEWSNAGDVRMAVTASFHSFSLAMSDIRTATSELGRHTWATTDERQKRSAGSLVKDVLGDQCWSFFFGSQNFPLQQQQQQWHYQHHQFWILVSWPGWRNPQLQPRCLWVLTNAAQRPERIKASSDAKLSSQSQNAWLWPIWWPIWWLVGGWALPLWKMMEWVTVGMMTFPRDGNIFQTFQTTKQSYIII